MNEEVLTNNALRFARKYLDDLKNGNVDALPIEKEWLRIENGGESNFLMKCGKMFYDRLVADGYKDADEKQIKRLNDFKPEEGVSYLMFNGTSPEQKFETDQFKKFLPLVETGKWYKMDKRELQDWANRHDYDMSDKESADQFWADLQRHDTNFNKAKITDEFVKSGPGIALSIGAPSAYEEGLKQSLTDDPMDTGKIKAQYANDAATNMAMAILGSKYASNPLAAGVTQSVAEGGRQGIKKAIDSDLEFQGTPIAGTFAAGTTVPMAAKGFAGWLKQSTNPSVRRFGVDMLKGAKGYDESVDELNQIKQTLIKARHPREVRAGISGPARAENETATSNAQKMLLNLGFNDENTTPFGRRYEARLFRPGVGEISSSAKFKYNQVMNNPTGQEYSIERMLSPEISDKDALRVLEDAYRGNYGKDLVDFNTAGPATLNYVFNRIAKNNPEEADRIIAQSMDNQSNVLAGLQTLPVRYARLAEGDVPATNPVVRALVGDVGHAESIPAYSVGKVLGGVGSTIEPAFKVNPYSMVTDVATTGDPTQAMKAKTEDYKNQSWYKKLRKQNPQMASAIDAAFKAKEEQNGL